MNKEIKEENKCPKCGSSKTVRFGFNNTQKYGNRARRKCKECAKTFYEEIQC